MDKRKLSDYRLIASIHTATVKNDGWIKEIDPHISPCINLSCHIDGTTSTKINANCLTGPIYAYSDFRDAWETILAGMGVDAYKLVRMDLSLDSFDPEHYLRYAKLNRYLISGLATSYEVRNVYRTLDLFSNKQISIAIKNKYFECEHYDKDRETGGADAVKSRLELRSKDFLEGDIEKEFCGHWFSRLDKAINNLKTAREVYNDRMIDEWKKDIEMPERVNGKKWREYRNRLDFIHRNRDRIFTREQMIKLYEAFGVSDPESSADDYLKEYGVEFFYGVDMKYAVSEMKRAILEFFRN